MAIRCVTEGTLLKAFYDIATSYLSVVFWAHFFFWHVLLSFLTSGKESKTI